MTVLDTLREQYESRDAAARQWKADGGRVVGYLCDHVPVELIAAAGMLPYRLSADPLSGSASLAQFVAPFVQQPVATPGFVASMEHRLLTNAFDFVDFLVVPNGRKSIQALYRDCITAKSAYPELDLPELYYLDKAMTPTYASSTFDRQQVFRLRERLEQWSGAKISDDALRQAMAEENEGRRLMAQLAIARSATPPLLSGVEALQVIGSRWFMARPRHNALLAELLEEGGRTPRSSPRVFVGGSPLDDDRLYRIIEASGATVVAEDHCWGGRCAELPVEETGDPMEALARRYHDKPACSIRFPIAATTATCLARARAARPDAAIFFVYETDNSQQWQVPDEARALEEAGLPVLRLPDRPYGLELGEVRGEIEQFLGALR